VRERIEAAIRGAASPTSALVIDGESITEVDASGVEMLTDLAERLREDGIALMLGRVRGTLRDRLLDTGAMDVIGAENIHPTVRSAVAAAVRPGSARRAAHPA
jgi:MFS superfamily sulfate permease-like transporter